MKFKFLVISLTTLLIATNMISCKTIPISDLTQEDGINRIKKNYEKKDWTDVISDTDEYKTRYPYSKYLQDIDLMQADAYYQSKRFPEAIAVYEDLLRKNPNNQNAAFANYRIAKSYDTQAPNNADRDQANSRKALDKYNYYLQTYPTTEWIEDAKKRRDLLNRRIAEYNEFIADFYWRKDLYAAALSRYLTIIELYPEYVDLAKESKEKASLCYQELAKILEKDASSDTYVYFKNETPESLRKKAEEIKN